MKEANILINVILAIFTAFFLSLFLTPLMGVIAKKFNIYDVPDIRKNHKNVTPLLGGVSICIATITSMIIFAKATNETSFILFIIGAVGVTVMGLIDDIITLSAKRRMIILLCIAIIVYFGSIQYYLPEMKILNNSFVRIVFLVYVILWLVGITNSINFIDGLDGLASYLSVISAIAFAIVFYLEGRYTFVLIIALALCGGIIGFIPYNRNPAMIFMGDSGSMFIGFMMAFLSITSIAKENTLLSIIFPVYILLIPILDVYMSILRRLILRKSILKPDRYHMHHLLFEHIKNQISVVIILSLIQIVFAAAGIYLFAFKQYLLGWIIFSIILIISTAYVFMVYKVKKENKV